jgi:hypothetical protein
MSSMIRMLSADYELSSISDFELVEEIVKRA